MSGYDLKCQAPGYTRTCGRESLFWICSPGILLIENSVASLFIIIIFFTDGSIQHILFHISLFFFLMFLWWFHSKHCLKGVFGQKAGEDSLLPSKPEIVSFSNIVCERVQTPKRQPVLRRGVQQHPCVSHTRWHEENCILPTRAPPLSVGDLSPWNFGKLEWNSQPGLRIPTST